MFYLNPTNFGEGGFIRLNVFLQGLRLLLLLSDDCFELWDGVLGHGVFPLVSGVHGAIISCLGRI